jgi:hypothetical protein
MVVGDAVQAARRKSCACRLWAGRRVQTLGLDGGAPVAAGRGSRYGLYCRAWETGRDEQRAAKTSDGAVGVGGANAVAEQTTDGLVCTREQSRREDGMRA